MSCSYNNVVVVGAGCYGTAIAQAFSVRSKKVLLVSDSKSITESINNSGINGVVFADVRLSKNISCTVDLGRSTDADIVFIAVPVNAMPEVCNGIKKHGVKAPIVLCSKGLDVDNARLMSELVEEIIDNDVAIFSGPSFAHEVVRGLPFGVNVAAKKRNLSDEIALYLSSPAFVIKPLDDYLGLQVAGAFKNILAVGCGILGGLKHGSNAVAKFMVDGLQEMAALTVVIGGRRETLMELGGIGDIILTCTSRQSRNVQFGEYIAGSGSLGNWSGNLAEGAFAAKAIPLFEEKYHVDLKIFHGIYEAIYDNNWKSHYT